MNTTDKISKELLSLTSFIRDNTKKNIVETFQKGQLTSKEDELKNLLFLVDSTIENSFQKALNNFQKSVNVHVNALKEELSFSKKK